MTSGYLLCSLRQWATIFLSFISGIFMTLITFALVNGNISNINIQIALIIALLFLVVSLAIVYLFVRIGLISCKL